MTFLVLFIPTSLWAQSVSVVLNREVESLQKKLGSGSPEVMAINAQKFGARIESFTIQSIGRLFKEEKKVFKELRNLIKEFEDHLGQVTKQGPHHNKDIALKGFSDFLRKSNFLFTLQKYNNEISKLSMTEAVSKKIVLAGIKKEIEDIMRKNYDLGHGETGLHELRRNIRWPISEMNVFRDYFTYQKKSCPSELLFNTGVKSIYHLVKENPKASFEIDYCAYSSLVGTTDYLGSIKDKLEASGEIEGKVSPEILKISQDVLNELKTNIFPNLL